MQGALARFDQAYGELRAQLGRGDVRAARAIQAHALHHAVHDVVDGLGTSLQFNAAMAGRLAVDIAQCKLRIGRVTFVLTVFSVLLVILAASLAVRLVLRHARLQEAHAELLAQRSDELEQFASRVAHDIRSPLTATMLALDLPLRDERTDARLRAQLARGKTSLQHVDRIVTGLFEFARAGAQPPGGPPAPIAPIVEDILGTLAPEADERGCVLVAEEIARGAVACSVGVLTSLLFNLLRNALKCLGDASVRRVTVRAVADGDRVRFEVDDTGPGLPPGLESRLFEPGVRGPDQREPGLGIGLATVKRLVERHAGRVGVASHPAHGCTFWFELPRALDGAGVADATGTLRT